MKRRLSVAFLTLVMLLSIIPSTVFAAECDHNLVESYLRRATCSSSGVKKTACTKCTVYRKYEVEAPTHGWKKTNTVKATCGKDGRTDYQCTLCSKTRSEKIEARPGHVYKQKKFKTVNATCLEPEMKYPVCDTCGYVDKDNGVEGKKKALGHDWGAADPEHYVQATCTQPGYKVSRCLRCGERNEKVDGTAKGHTYIAAPTVAATTTKPGKKGGKICSVCGAEDPNNPREEIPALGGNHVCAFTETELKKASCVSSGITKKTCTECKKVVYEYKKDGHAWDNGEVTTEATCTKAGVKTFTCTTCATKKTEKIPALKHNYNIETVKQPATCTENGVKAIECSLCGDIQKNITIEKTEHKWADISGGTPATCIATGTKNQECQNCHALRTVTAPKTEHNFSGEVEETPATCTEAGSKKTHCTTPGCTASKTETIEALDHAWDGGVEDKAATCTETGVMTVTCQKCQATKTETVPAVGHKHQQVASDSAACEKEGKVYYRCQNAGCGDEYSEPIKALGHDFSANGPTCGRCGAQNPDYKAPAETPAP